MCSQCPTFTNCYYYSNSRSICKTWQYITAVNIYMYSLPVAIFNLQNVLLQLYVFTIDLANSTNADLDSVIVVFEYTIIYGSTRQHCPYSVFIEYLTMISTFPPANSSLYLFYFFYLSEISYCYLCILSTSTQVTTKHN